jgi:DNA polymerase
MATDLNRMTAERMSGKKTDSRAPDLSEVARDLRAYLTQEREEGAIEVPLGDGARRWLRSARRTAKTSPGVPRADASVPESHAIARAARIRAPEPVARPQPDAREGGDALESIAAEIAVCKVCPLHSTRTRTVPGQGNRTPEIMFVGEGPGEDEDLQGLAFVGKAGQLLTKMIAAMGFSRDEVFIGNIVKCRPPGNRAPVPEEMDACMPYLKRQIAALKPKIIVALGGTAVKGLMGVTDGITRLRGRWMDLNGTPLMPTYHPAYLLRSPNMKHEVWADLKEVLKRLGRTPPASSR